MGGLNNPFPTIEEFIRDTNSQWDVIPLNAGWTTAVTGSGAVGQAPRVLDLSTGATASSTALMRTSVWPMLHVGKARDVVNFSKRMVIYLAFHVFGTTNGASRFTLGKASADGVGDLTRKGFGIRIDNAAIKGVVHNGTDLAAINLSTTLTEANVYSVIIINKGDGNFEWLVSGVSKGTSAAGPTGDSAANESVFQSEASNGADSAAQVLRIASFKVWTQQ